jgi:hypothetical protein
VGEGEEILYGGDPLEDFSFGAFLERFVFKQPKKKRSEAEEKGGSIMQRLSKGRSARFEITVNDAKFLEQEEK